MIISGGQTPHCVFLPLGMEGRKESCCPILGHGQPTCLQGVTASFRMVQDRTAQALLRTSKEASATGESGPAGGSSCQGAQTSFQRPLGPRQDSLFKLSVPREKRFIDLGSPWPGGGSQAGMRG